MLGYGRDGSLLLKYINLNIPVKFSFGKSFT